MRDHVRRSQELGLPIPKWGGGPGLPCEWGHARWAWPRSSEDHLKMGQ